MTHLDLDGLADVLAGTGDREHLDACPACRSRLAELEAAMPGVTASLAALDAPQLPAEVAERLDRALAAAKPGPSADVLPLRARRSRWVPALAGVAAAAVVVTGAVLLTRPGHSGSTSPTARATFAVSSSGTDYTRASAQLAAALPALLAGHATRQELSFDKSLGSGAPVPTTLGDTRASAGSALPAPATDPLARLRTTDGLASCLAALSDPSEPGLPLALDYARFLGQPALVVVLPTTTAAKVDVFVVGAGCAQQDAKLLYFARLAKP